MSIGISVNVGLNKVTSNVFSADALEGCEKDATAMHDIAVRQNKFDPNLSKLLLGPEAKLDNVVNAVKTAAAKLEAGDLFFFTFAGHGTFKVAPTAVEETDKHDESIVLADHLLIDNVWRNELWPLFKPGVRAVAIADCCHSATIVSEDMMMPFPVTAPRHRQTEVATRPTPRMRAILREEAQKELNAFRGLYDTQLAATGNEINCSRLFLSACGDQEKAADGHEHGEFTRILLEIWDEGRFPGNNYKELMDRIKERFVNTSQTPQLTAMGNPDFSTTHRPFAI